MKTVDTATLIDQLTRDLKPTGSPVSANRLAASSAAAAAALVALILVLACTPRPDPWALLHNAGFVISALLLVRIAAHAVATAAWLSIPGFPNGKRWWSSAAWASGLLGLFLLIRCVAGGTPELTEGLDASGLGCSEQVALISLAPLAFLIFRLRRSASTRPGRTGLLLGVSAGALAATAQSLICTNDHPAHLLSWHFLVPLALLAGTGFIFGRWLLRW